VTTWTREAIGAFVRGRAISLRDPAVEPMPVPAWMAESAAGVSTVTGAQRVAAAHPDDRDAIANTFLGAVIDPGVAYHVSYRIRSGEDWVGETLSVLNLSDVEEVGGIICAMVRDESPDGALTVEVQPLSIYEHDSAAWVLGTINFTGRIIHVEGRVRDLFGRDPDDVVGRSHLELLDPGSYEDGLPMWFSLFEAPGITRTSRRRYVWPDGTSIWGETSYLSRALDDGRMEVFFVAVDITARRAQEDALRASHEEVRVLAEESRHVAEEFRLLAEEIPAAVFRADRTGRILFHNARWESVLRGDRAEVAHLSETVHPDDRQALRDLLDGLTAESHAERRSVRLRGRQPGQMLEIVCRVVKEPDGDLRTVVGSIDDVSDEVALRTRAEEDGLTGLLNRQAMDERIDRSLQAGRTCILVFIDLDGFKPVNDTYGHERGDLVLRTMAGRIRTAMRPEDHVGRYGGDEFVVLCEDAGPELPGADDAVRARLNAAVHQPVTWAGGSWSAGASIGVARPRPGDTLASFVRRADLDMLASKRRHHAARAAPRPGGRPRSEPDHKGSSRILDG